MKPSTNDKANADTLQPGKVICVGSWFSDEGKSLLSAELALALADQGRRVVLLDLGTGARNLGFLFNVWPERGVNHVLAGEALIGQVMVPAAGSVDLIPAMTPDGQERIGRDKMQRLLAVMHELAVDHDYILVDCPAGAPHWLRPLWQSAGAVITVVTPETLELDSWWTVGGQTVPSKALPLVVVNKVAADGDLGGAAELPICHVLKCQDEDAPPIVLGVLHWSERLALALADGLPLALESAEGSVAMDIAGIAAALVTSMQDVPAFSAHWLDSEPCDVHISGGNDGADSVSDDIVELFRRYRAAFESSAHDADRCLDQLVALFDAYGKVMRENPVTTLAHLVNRLDEKGEPGKVLAETILFLEREYYARFRRPLRWVDEDVLEELFSDGFSEAALLRLNRQLQLSYRMRFKRDLTDPVVELVAQIRSPAFRKQRFFAIQHALMQAFAHRFGSLYQDAVPGPPEKVTPASRVSVQSPPPAVTREMLVPTDVIAERKLVLAQRHAAHAHDPGQAPKRGRPWKHDPIQSVPRLGTETILGLLTVALIAGAMLFRPPWPNVSPTPRAGIEASRPAEPKPVALPTPVEPQAAVAPVLVETAPPAPPEVPMTPDEITAEVITTVAEAEASVAKVVQPQPEVDTVSLSADEDCWVSISEKSGRRLAHELLKKGGRVSYSGTAPFAMTVGNSRAVSISFNEQTVDPATYRRRRVAHLTLPEGG